jgi:hypothetical protein
MLDVRIRCLMFLSTNRDERTGSTPLGRYLLTKTMERIRNQCASCLKIFVLMLIPRKNKNRDDMTHPAIQNLRQRIWVAGGATS